MDSVGNLENEALKRKERLKALKRGEIKTVITTNGEQVKDEEVEDGEVKSFPKPIFRNYTPKDDQLKENVLPKPNLIEISNEISEQLASSKPVPLIEKEIDLTTLAPQKVDWDLKRDIEKKLRLLEKRTQKAIVELIRDRLKSNTNTDLAELVSVVSRDKNQNQDQKTKSQSSDDDSEDDDAESVNQQDNHSQNEMESNKEKEEEGEESFINTKTEISDDDDY
jgi:coiled-coil domain-containing protein 12